MVFATTPTQVAATAPSPTVPRKADLPGTGLPAALSNGGAQATCGGERVSPAPSGAAAAAIAGGVIPSGAAASASGAGSTSAAGASAGSSVNNVSNAANIGGPAPGPAVPAQSPAPAALPPPSLPPPYPSTMQVGYRYIGNILLNSCCIVIKSIF